MSDQPIREPMPTPAQLERFAMELVYTYGQVPGRQVRRKGYELLKMLGHDVDEMIKATGE